MRVSEYARAEACDVRIKYNNYTHANTRCEAQASAGAGACLSGGWYYLSSATCLIQPHLLCVFVVSTIIKFCHIIATFEEHLR